MIQYSKLLPSLRAIRIFAALSIASAGVGIPNHAIAPTLATESAPVPKRIHDKAIAAGPAVGGVETRPVAMKFEDHTTPTETHWSHVETGSGQAVSLLADSDGSLFEDDNAVRASFGLGSGGHGLTGSGGGALVRTAAAAPALSAMGAGSPGGVLGEWAAYQTATPSTATPGGGISPPSANQDPNQTSGTNPQTAAAGNSTPGNPTPTNPAASGNQTPADTSVPTPASLALLVTGLLGLAMTRRRDRRLT